MTSPVTACEACGHPSHNGFCATMTGCMGGSRGCRTTVSVKMDTSVDAVEALATRLENRVAIDRMDNANWTSGRTNMETEAARLLRALLVERKLSEDQINSWRSEFCEIVKIRDRYVTELNRAVGVLVCVEFAGRTVNDEACCPHCRCPKHATTQSGIGHFLGCDLHASIERDWPIQ